MKKLFCLILSLALLISIIPSGIVASANSNYLTIKVMENPETGEIFAYVENCDKNAKGSITIPSTYKGVPVTRIKENAFACCNKITSVTIPNSVTDVQKQGFYECTSLKKVTLSNKMTSILPGTFYNCSSLETITLPSSIKEIYNEGFFGCSSLKKINLENITDIYPDAFSDTALKQINLESIKIIDMRAFINCKNLVDIKFGSGIRAVGFCAFANTAYYNNENNWEKGALYLNNILLNVKPEVTGTFSVKKGTKIIGGHALVYCKDGDYVYAETNQNITKIVLPSTITYINGGAFSNCKSLKEINLPNSIKELGGAVFNECRSLEEITIPKNVKRIENGLFYNCLKLKKVIIPEGVEEIGDHAFCDCWGLKNITLPSTLKKIENFAFYYCPYIENITIPNKVTYIGDSAFAGCHKFTKVTLPSSVKHIGKEAFYYCSSLTEIKGGKNIEEVGSDICLETPFYNNQKNYENGVLYIGSALIKAKPTITSHTIKSGTKVIADEAFLDCKSLKKITIPSSVKTIGEYAFKNCSSLTSLIIPRGLVTIKVKAFENCTGIKTLTLPSSLKTIGYHAFADCDSITAIYYEGTKSKFETLYNYSSLEITKAHYNSCIAKSKHTYSYTCDTTCNVCSSKRTINHSYTTKVNTKATLSKNGEIGYKCSKCGYVSSKTTLTNKIKSVKLSTTTYTYNGKTKTPSVIVKDAAGKTLKKNTDYTVSYAKGRKNVGTYKVTVNFKGKYSGTKTLTFKIKPISISKCNLKLSTTAYTYNGKTKTPSVVVKNASGTTLKKGTHYTVTYTKGRKSVGSYKVTVKMKGNYSGTKTLTFKINPPKTSISKLTAGKKSLAVKLTKKTAQVSGYQIQYSRSKSFKSYKTATLTSNKKTSATLKKLSAKKTYYVRVRTYKTVGKTKYYSTWSTIKYKKTK